VVYGTYTRPTAHRCRKYATSAQQQGSVLKPVGEAFDGFLLCVSSLTSLETFCLSVFTAFLCHLSVSGLQSCFGNKKCSFFVFFLFRGKGGLVQSAEHLICWSSWLDQNGEFDLPGVKSSLLLLLIWM